MSFWSPFWILYSLYEYLRVLTEEAACHEVSFFFQGSLFHQPNASMETLPNPFLCQKCSRDVMPYTSLVLSSTWPIDSNSDQVSYSIQSSWVIKNVIFKNIAQLMSSTWYSKYKTAFTPLSFNSGLSGEILTKKKSPHNNISPFFQYTITKTKNK